MLSIGRSWCAKRSVTHSTSSNLVQAECEAGEHHCPPDWCTDDVDSTVLHARRVERGSIGVPGDQDELRSSPVGGSAVPDFNLDLPVIRVLVDDARFPSVVECATAWLHAYDKAHQHSADDASALFQAAEAWDRAAAKWRLGGRSVDQNSAS